MHSQSDFKTKHLSSTLCTQYYSKGHVVILHRWIWITLKFFRVKEEHKISNWNQHLFSIIHKPPESTLKSQHSFPLHNADVAISKQSLITQNTIPSKRKLKSTNSIASSSRNKHSESVMWLDWLLRFERRGSGGWKQVDLGKWYYPLNVRKSSHLGPIGTRTLHQTHLQPPKGSSEFHASTNAL